MKKQFRIEVKLVFWLFMIAIGLIVFTINSCTSPKDFIYKDNYRRMHTATQEEINDFHKYTQTKNRNENE